MMGNPDPLKLVAQRLACAKCGVRPRFANISRCRECLRIDTARELQARDRHLASRGGAQSDHQQGAASSVVTRQTRRAARPSEAISRPAPAARANVQSRQPPEPMTAKSWKARLADWTKRCWGANDPTVQERIGIRDLGGDIIEQTASKIDYVYGGPHGAAHMRVFANGDPHLDVMRSAAERMWRLPRKGEVVTANGVSDLRTACPHCGARVKSPCNDSRARNCPNRSRGNR